MALWFLVGHEKTFTDINKYANFTHDYDDDCIYPHAEFTQYSTKLANSLPVSHCSAIAAMS